MTMIRLISVIVLVTVPILVIDGMSVKSDSQRGRRIGQFDDVVFHIPCQQDCYIHQEPVYYDQYNRENLLILDIGPVTVSIFIHDSGDEQRTAGIRISPQVYWTALENKPEDSALLVSCMNKNQVKLDWGKVIIITGCKMEYVQR